MNKTFNKTLIIGIIIGGTIFGSVGVGAVTYLYNSNQVSYTPTDTNWNVSDVKSALDELHGLTNAGNATVEDISEGKTAVVQGKLLTGTSKSLNTISIPTLKMGESEDVFTVSDYTKMSIDKLYRSHVYSYTTIKCDNTNLFYEVAATNGTQNFTNLSYDISACSTVSIIHSFYGTYTSYLELTNLIFS